MNVNESAKPNIVQAIIDGMAANIIDLFRPIASLMNQPVNEANG